MKIYSYVVARDYGFAPNPFYGICTLAACKPVIRKHADIGDWIVGTGSKTYELEGKLVFYMEITETLTFDQYWKDPRFKCKRPELQGSIKQAFGDNIYHHSKNTKKWLQEDSHHSLEDGSINTANVKNDTQADRVLISLNFAYWGGSGPRIPKRFRNSNQDLCKKGSAHKCHFHEQFIERVIDWFNSMPDRGQVGNPSEFSNLV